MTITQQVLITLVSLECGECHLTFGLEEHHLRDLKRTGAKFWCPNGHGISYSETETERLRKQLAAAERQAEYARTSRRALNDQLEATRRSLAAQKGVKTRMKNRIANGVCPCCGRSFENVRRHMASQHPTWTEQAVD